MLFMESSKNILSGTAGKLADVAAIVLDSWRQTDVRRLSLVSVKTSG